MNTIDNYLLFLHEQEEGFLQEAPVGALAGVAGKVAGVAGSVSPVTYAFYGLPYAIKLANVAYKNTFNKSHKACRGLDKAAYTSCVRKFKLQAYMQQIVAMKKAASSCNKDKNPAKCKQKIQEKIAKIQFRAKATKDSIVRAKKAEIAQAQAAGKAQAAKMAPQR